MIYELTIPDVPPSLNKVGSRGSHWAWTAAKKAWQTDMETLLMAERVPRGMASVRASASMRFSVRRDRDEGNFRALLEKSLGDALVNGGWLADDTPDQYQFARLHFEDKPGPKQTTIVLEVTL